MRWFIWGLVCLSFPAVAQQAHVAVAANFASPAKAIATLFEKAQAGHRILLTSGSTGKFYAQIASGAPFDVLLSADAQTPERLEREGLTVSGQRFPYALGKLVLWSSKPGVVDDGGEILRKQVFRYLAIANPRLAPYGAAAQQTLEKLGLWTALQGRIVLGENIAQTYQFVSTGNADLGFIAYSQIHEPGKASAGSYWVVPASLHSPIRQDAALLTRARDNSAAQMFFTFLRSGQAQEVIRAYGYDLP